MVTLEEILDSFQLETEVRDTLLARLRDREDGIADYLRLAGMQLGMMPGLVSGVIVNSTLGTPLGDEEKLLIAEQFNAAIEELRRAIEQQQRNNGNEN